MRTRPAHIEPGCPWCDSDHDPDIECRSGPVSVRFELGPERKPVQPVRELIRDKDGKLIGVRTGTSGAPPVRP
jgi:hypothetical protein